METENCRDNFRRFEMKKIVTRNLAYYKGRLIDFQYLIMTEEDIDWVKVYLISYLKCFVEIKIAEARLGFPQGILK